MDVNAHISLTSSRNACAMLNVEEGEACYTFCSDNDNMTIKETFRQKASEWFFEAVSMNKIPSDFSIERLIFVTGFYKCWNWEAAALSLSSSTGDLSFTIKANQAGGRTSFHWDSVQHLSPDYTTGHRHPSGSLPRLSTPRTDSSDLQARGNITHGTNNTSGIGASFEKCCREHHGHADQNQCIFLRGFRIRGRLFRGDQIEKLLALKESEPSLRERLKRHVNLISKTSKPPGYESSQRSSSANDYVEPIEEFPDTDFCVSCQLVNENLVVIYSVF